MVRKQKNNRKRWYSDLPVSRWNQDDWDDMMHPDYIEEEQFELMMENMLDALREGFCD